ncbi:MAG: glycosyltransferase family 4 protein [Acidobacteria bacterium]|nr:glycosyltransferase family 4 protein [Acidobacteriota bacterium]
MRVLLGVDQLSRPQPGGIGSYVTGLLRGLAEVGVASSITTLGPRGSRAPHPLIAHRTTPVGLTLLTKTWSRWPWGVGGELDVLHATSMAGPFGGGPRGVRHTAALHDLLWRDAPELSTPRGVAFHEARLQRIIRDESIRIIASSPLLPDRLRELGVAEERIVLTRLGVDEADVAAATRDEVREVLHQRGVDGPFTLSVGTLEPRKNIPTLVEAHRRARREVPDLGPLVLVGPTGWGDVEVGDAVALGRQSRDLLLGLFREAAVVAYVPLSEGFGLPPVEALHQGTAVVASTTVPSVARNERAVRVSPHDVDEVADGLRRAVAEGNDASLRESRRLSVADLTWANCARDHLAAWS